MQCIAQSGRKLASLCLTGILALAAGCAKPSPPASSTDEGKTSLKLVRFQTDWYPQAEHGGHYQAAARGFYADAGLDVDILPGGPNSFIPQKIATGQADLAVGRADDVAVAVSQGYPLIMVSALMQHDPQCVIVHNDSPVRSFEDLAGRSIMAFPGATWIKHVKAKYNIEFNLIPLNFGIARFLADKNFIQQAFVTNEPFLLKEAGVKVRALLVADTDFDSYRVIYSSQKYVRENPEAVRAFVAQSIRGWEDFLNGDATPGKKLIALRNENMTDGCMDYAIASMRDNHLISGYTERGERTGLLKRKRLRDLLGRLEELKVLPAPISLERVATFDLLPPELQALAE